MFMVIVLWIVRVAVALMFFVIGGMKVMNRTRLGRLGKKFGDAHVSIPLPMRVLGGAEVFGALGLILPVATGIAPVLTIVAAVCLGIVLVGASILHLLHRETNQLALPLTLLVLTVFIVIGHLVWVSLV
jgi:uncharacterized membrane protein YphA (DoxX/SURF4 family)